MGILVYWIPAAVWASVIFFLSHQSQLPGKDTIPDGPAHFVAFGILGFLVAVGITRGFVNRLDATGFVWVVVVTALYGIFDEWHQTFVPERFFSLADWAMDILGGVAAAFLARFVGRRRVRA